MPGGVSLEDKRYSIGVEAVLCGGVLVLDVQCESGMSYVREGLEEAVRRCVPEDDLHYRLQWLSDGLSVSSLKAYPIHTEDSMSLTCCGSSEYIIEALCGYFLIQCYRFC